MLGARFTNLNKQRELEWVTHGEVVRFEPGREVAFRIEENCVIRSLSLAPAGDGTRLVQRRETRRHLRAPRRAQRRDFGGQIAFTASMQEGMTETLAAIKATAEARPGACSGVEPRSNSTTSSCMMWWSTPVKPATTPYRPNVALDRRVPRQGSPVPRPVACH